MLAADDIKKPCEDPVGGQGSGPPMKNHKNIGFLCYSGPDPLKNQHSMLRWLADDGQLIVVFGSSLPSSTKTKGGPPLTKFSLSVHENCVF